MPFRDASVFNGMWTIWLRNSAIALCMLFGCPSAQSQYHVDVWKTDEGLPQSSVTSIVQSHEGYLWLGTFGGLARFDGVQFKTFSAAKSSIPNRRILSLHEDRHGILWAGAEEGDLIRIEKNIVKTYSVPNRGGSSLYIRNFAETADGALWLHTAENQLIRFENETFTIVSTNWNLRGTQVNSIWSGPDGTLWVGTERELARREAGQFKIVWSDEQEKNFSVDLLSAGTEGGIWVAGNGRLRRFLQDHWINDCGPYPWSKGVLTCLLEDRDGQIWAGTYGGGLYKRGKDGEWMQLSRAAGLPGNVIRSLREDKEGNIWVGTEGRGLVRIKPAIFSSYGRAQGLGSDLVTTLCEGDDGELWIGTNGEGIDRLKNGIVEHFKAKEGLSNECVWSVVRDQNKQIWAGTWGGGLFKLDGGRFTRFASDRIAQIVCGLYEDSKNRLWIGQTWNEPRIVRLESGAPIALNLPTLLGRSDTRAIVEDKFGDIWFGTRGDGLYRYRNGAFAHFTREGGLVSDFILSLYADNEGVLWVGTRDGLTRLQDGKCISFSTKDGLVDNAICFITEDDSGHMWFGSGSGVFQTVKAELGRTHAGERQALHCLSYTRADGLPSLDCTSGCQPAGCKTRDGRLWFPTVNGLAVVDPKRVPSNPLPPAVLIEELVVESNKQNTTREGPEKDSVRYDLAATRGLADREPLKIGPGNARFEFHYTGLSFTAPEKVHFKYRLEGLERDWVDAGTKRTAPYSYLPPGRYQFRVLACNNDGVWNEIGASLPLILLPHFWQTWWFRTIIFAAAILFLAAIYEVRLASQRRLVRLRLRIARDLHDEVGSNLGSIALLSEVSKNAGSREEASEIRRIAVSTIESLRDIVWFLDPASDNMSDLKLKMKDTARSMLPGIVFEFNALEDPNGAKPPLELRRNLFPIYKEILHNVAKHSLAGHVQIEVQNTARIFRLKVRDDGKGFDERSVQPGNGLKNLRRRTSDMGGNIRIESQPGAGTTITVTAPIT